MDWSVGFFLPFSAAFALSVVLMPMARGAGWVDSPCVRKRHRGEVPLVGGVAIFLAIAAGTAFAGLWREYAVLLAFGAVLLACGLYDDVKPLSARFRFLAQGAAAVVAALVGGVVLHDVGNLVSTGVIALGVAAVPVTAFCFVGVMNAFNMSDGMDGLAGGLALVTLLSMSYLAVGIRHAEFLTLAAGAVAGFLLLNMRSPVLGRAKVFMGDAGSLMLGGILAWFLIDLSQGADRAFSPSVALWLFALPLMDTVSLMIRRIRKGRSPFSPGREHFHHILQRAGFSVGQSGSIMVGLATLLAIVGVVGSELLIPEPVLFFGFLGVFGVYLWGMSRAWRLVRYLRRQRHTARPVRFPASVQEEGHYEGIASYYDKAA
ncbi:hypothetical protein [Thiohalomonas denitrificans]|uniref:UDP-GlcNAc:undecaprenyl-phosphate GlcNAc-1-phosphate transferase n=1 Tax=Thiohalomonas denitrificans TaxID=415747 RepID=A0A1G5R0C8_9GAMM|nr:hypothetical protein [Thiohalomonas denitrificans]SCZ67270.1 UDP-GlcNAc:undecaprenyl-phosphate GlcNAc-1-phosphate transferase [Thiohalomonas denitrificans]